MDITMLGKTIKKQIRNETTVVGTVVAIDKDRDFILEIDERSDIEGWSHEENPVVMEAIQKSVEGYKFSTAKGYWVVGHRIKDYEVIEKWEDIEDIFNIDLSGKNISFDGFLGNGYGKVVGKYHEGELVLLDEEKSDFAGWSREADIDKKAFVLNEGVEVKEDDRFWIVSRMQIVKIDE